jgi:hypothetical protein
MNNPNYNIINILVKNTQKFNPNSMDYYINKIDKDVRIKTVDYFLKDDKTLSLVPEILLHLLLGNIIEEEF